jgi:hypothetical protein
MNARNREKKARLYKENKEEENSAKYTCNESGLSVTINNCCDCPEYRELLCYGGIPLQNASAAELKGGHFNA